ncbi:MAG: DUF6569 family protein [Acidimicrobiales bacterium]|jgi:hypothetical protein
MQVFNRELEIGDRQDIGGLGVFPLTGASNATPPYLTGPEAFEAGLIEVSELDPPEVPSLLVSNLGDVPILLVEGEMLVGGDQNRTMNVTVLCPPKSVIIVPVSCVEAGRWGARRTMSASSRHAPGSLRSVKTSTLESRGEPASDRRSDQGRVWEEVSRQSEVHSLYSTTSAIDDVQEEFELSIAEALDRITPVPNQIGVVCTIDGEVVGLDLFDKPRTLARYLRAIVAGHALDAHGSTSSYDAIHAIERFLAKVDTTPKDGGPGVGLGEEIVLRGQLSGVGLSYDKGLVHLAAFPSDAEGG